MEKVGSDNMKNIKIAYDTTNFIELLINRVTGEIVGKIYPKIPILGMTKHCKLNATKRPKIRYKVTYFAISKSQFV